MRGKLLHHAPETRATFPSNAEGSKTLSLYTGRGTSLVAAMLDRLGRRSREAISAVFVQ